MMRSGFHRAWIAIAIALAGLVLVGACGQSGGDGPGAAIDRSGEAAVAEAGAATAGAANAGAGRATFQADSPGRGAVAGVESPRFHVVPLDKATVAPLRGPAPPPEAELSYKVLYEMFLARNHQDVNTDLAAIRYAQQNAPMLFGPACGSTTNELIRNEIAASREVARLRASYDAVSSRILAANPARRFHVRYRLLNKLGRFDERRQAFPLTLSAHRNSGLQLNVALDGATTQGGSGHEVLQGVAAAPERKLCNQFYNLLETTAFNRASNHRSDDKRHDDELYSKIPEMFSFQPRIPNESMPIQEVQQMQVTRERHLHGASGFPKFLPMSTADAAGFIDRNRDRALVFDVVYDATARSVRPAVWAPSQVTPEAAFDVRVVSLSVIDPGSDEVLLHWENDPAPPLPHAGVPEELQDLYRRYGARTWRGRLVGAPEGYDDSGITEGAALRILEVAALKAHPELREDPRRDAVFCRHFPYREQNEGGDTTVTDEALDRLVAAAPSLPVRMVSISRFGLPPYDAGKGGFELDSGATTMLPRLNVASSDLIAPTSAAFAMPGFLPMSEQEAGAFEKRLRRTGRFARAFQVVAFDVTGFDTGTEGRGGDVRNTVMGLRIKPVSVAIYADEALTHKLLEYTPAVADMTFFGDKAPLIRKGANLPVANADTLSLFYLRHAGAEAFDKEVYRKWLALRQQMEKWLWKAGPWQWTLRDPWANFSPANLLTHGDYPTDEAIADFARWSARRAAVLSDRIRFVLGPGLITGRHRPEERDGVRMNEILSWNRVDKAELGLRLQDGDGSSFPALDERYGEDGYYALDLATIGNDSSGRRHIVVLFEIPGENLLGLPTEEDPGLAVASIDFVTRVAGTETLAASRKPRADQLFLIKLQPEALVWRDDHGNALKQMKVRFQ